MLNRLQNTFAEARTRAGDTSLPLVFIILSNAAILFTALISDWPLSSLLLVYWMESALLGLFTLLRIAAAKKRDFFGGPVKVGISFFFHYGLFSLLHLIFVAAWAQREAGGELKIGPESWIAVGTLFVQQAYDYFARYLGQGEYRSAVPHKESSRPYARVFVMQFAILGGAYLLSGLNSAAGPAVILTIGRTLYDVISHQRSVAKRRQDGAAPEQAVAVSRGLR